MHLLEAAHEERSRTLAPERWEARREISQVLKTILLAEDDEDLRYVMECSLRTMGYDVVACADAQLASTAFHTHPAIDILLTDFDMPGKSGLELARELTALCPALPVMILTGSVLAAATMQEIRDRRWTYVSKPCYLSALESNLQTMLMVELPAAAA